MNLVLPYLKTYAALVGSIATALLAIYTGNEVLTVIAVVCTTVVTWTVPNTPVGRHRAESVEPPA